MQVFTGRLHRHPASHAQARLSRGSDDASPGPMEVPIRKRSSRLILVAARICVAGRHCPVNCLVAVGAEPVPSGLVITVPSKPAPDAAAAFAFAAAPVACTEELA